MAPAAALTVVDSLSLPSESASKPLFADCAGTTTCVANGSHLIYTRVHWRNVYKTHGVEIVNEMCFCMRVSNLTLAQSPIPRCCCPASRGNFAAGSSSVSDGIGEAEDYARR